MALLDRAIVRTLPAVPKPIVRRISERYIAGTRVEDACRVVKELNRERKMATMDVLGEEITTPEEARHIGYEYENVFRTIAEQDLDSNVSVKLTGLGLKLDHGLCRRHRLVVQPPTPDGGGVGERRQPPVERAAHRTRSRSRTAASRVSR